MSIRTITYNFNGSIVFPDTTQYGGVRYEDNATLVRFAIAPDFEQNAIEKFGAKELIYRIDFNGTLSGYNPSESLEKQGNTVGRTIPLAVTAAGEQITACLVVTALSDDNKVVGVISSVPVKIYFDNVQRDESDGIEITENITAIENKTLKLCGLAEKFSDSAKNSASFAAAAADGAEEAMLKTCEMKRALEDGTEFVFLGGDSAENIEVKLVVDEEISTVSENAVKNKAITEAINSAKNELKEYTDNKIETFGFIKVETTLPIEGIENRIYLVPKNEAEGNDLFDEYIWANDKWEFITTKQMDLSGYIKKEDVADYVVEEGNFGIWRYRKWQSGIAECWGNCTTSITCTEQRNSVYVDSLKRLSLPTDLFIAAPIVNINALHATGWNFLIAHIYSVDMAVVSYLPASTGQINDMQTVTFSVTARGKWKREEV